MGVVVGLVVAALSYGLVTWLQPGVTAGLLIALLAAAGFYVCTLIGQRDFGGKANAEVSLYLATLGIAAAVVIPTLTGAG
ncbi:MAG: hypothetical protein AAF458_07465 [Pseudomonadota bacterium]